VGKYHPMRRGDYIQTVRFFDKPLVLVCMADLL